MYCAVVVIKCNEPKNHLGDRVKLRLLSQWVWGSASHSQVLTKLLVGPYFEKQGYIYIVHVRDPPVRDIWAVINSAAINSRVRRPNTELVALVLTV